MDATDVLLSAVGESHFAQSCKELLERSSVSIHAVMVQRGASSLSTASAASRGHAVGPGPLELHGRPMVRAASLQEEQHCVDRKSFFI